MNSLWSNLYDRAKDRRYGALFLACLLAFIGLLILWAFMGTIINEFELQGYFLPVLAGVGLLAVAWVLLAFRGRGSAGGSVTNIRHCRVTNCA